MLSLLLSACGGSGSTPDSAGSGASSSGGGSSGGGNDPVSGLDARPSNTTCLAGLPPTPTSSTIATRNAFPNLPAFSAPVALIQPPNDNSQWYALEQAGRIYRFDNNAAVSTRQLVADLRDNNGGPVLDGGERGLLGMAFHPDYANNRRVYLSYSSASSVSGDDHRSVLSRFTMSADGATLQTQSAVEVFTVGQPFSNHNGGQIAFGPDNFLYFGLGDGGSGGDPRDLAQNINSTLGAMLRIDVDNGSPYSIPSDNPFANGQCGSGGCPEIYAWGFRNPWRWSFDQSTGDLWMGDVGQGNWEEVNRVNRNGNYGWRCFEGNNAFNTTSCGPLSSYAAPVSEYSHNGGHCSITGGYVYRGSRLPHLVGRFIYGDFCSGQTWSVNSSGVVQPLLDTAFGISSFAQDQSGEVYVVDRSAGRFHQFVPGQPTGTAGGPARLLSQIGCVDPNNPQVPASGLIPYDINAPFWSDGAEKMRWLALPDSTTIDVSTTGDWQFPLGSVLMKHFRLNGSLIETRLLMHHDNGEWAGYSYEWNGAQTDATLLDAGKSVSIGGQLWPFPSRSECINCHTAVAGRTLGPETAQLNRKQLWPSTGRTANILTTADAVGLLATPLGGQPSNHAVLSTPSDSSAETGLRARAWLHTNCAQCHQPGGPTTVDIDLRYSTSLASMNICDTTPNAGNLGIDDARLLLPGESARSILAARIKRRDAAAMPPLGSNLIDQQGAQLIDDWINGLQACP